MLCGTILLVGDTIHIVLTICITSHVIHDLQGENLFSEGKDAFVTQTLQLLIYVIKDFNVNRELLSFHFAKCVMLIIKRTTI